MRPQLLAWMVMSLFLAVPTSAQTVLAERFLFTSTDCEVSSGSGSPEDAVIGDLCDIYIQLDGGASTILWIKESGAGPNTGWKSVYTTGTAVTTGTGAANHVAYWTGAGTLSYDDGQLYWDAAKNLLLIGDTANAQSTVGLTINQGTADDEILSLKSSEVAHPFTAFVEADTYGTVSKAVGADGGLYLRGLSEGGTAGLSFFGFLGSADPTDTIPAIVLRGYKSDGSTSYAALGAAETVFQVGNSSTNLVTVFGDGKVGVGTIGPDARVDALATSGAQYRATYTDGSVYTDLTTDSSGNFTVNASGTKTTISDNLVVSGTGPHALGGTTLARFMLTLANGTTFTSDGSSTLAGGVITLGTIVGAAGDTGSLFGTRLNHAVTTQAAAETIDYVAQLVLIEPAITKNVTTITNADTLLILNAPTEGATNSALRVAAGMTRLDGGAVIAGTFAAVLANTKVWIGQAGGASAEYALSGDATMTAGGVVTVANDSHDHTAASISGLEAGDFANVATSLVLMGPEVGNPTPAVPSFRALDLGDITVARARYYRGADQSIADSTWADLAWDTLVFNASFSATPTTSVVFPVAGGYQVTGAVVWDNNATGGRWIVVDYSDGSTQDCKIRAEPDATYDHPMAIPSCVINAAASATVKVSVWQDSGDALNVIGSSYSTIQIVRLW